MTKRPCSPVSSFLCAGTEIMTGRVRNLFVSVGFTMSCAFGFLITPLFAYALRDWKSLLMVVSLPCIIYIPLYWWVYLFIMDYLFDERFRCCLHEKKVEMPQTQCFWMSRKCRDQTRKKRPQNALKISKTCQTPPFAKSLAVICDSSDSKSSLNKTSLFHLHLRAQIQPYLSPKDVIKAWLTQSCFYHILVRTLKFSLWLNGTDLSSSALTHLKMNFPSFD